MHEMAIVENVVDIVVKQATKAEAVKVLEVKLKIGEIRDIVESLMEKAFRFIARDTIASDAKLEIEKIPLVVQCNKCGSQSREQISNYATICCKKCGSKTFSMVSGNEFYIENIEIL